MESAAPAVEGLLGLGGGEAAVLVLVLLSIAVGVAWLMRRARQMEESQNAEAMLFERQIMKHISPPPPMPIGAGPPVPSAAMVSSDLRPLNPVNPPEAKPSDANGSSTETLSGEVLGKLQSANLLECVEGPVRTRNPRINGTVVKLRDQRKIAILENPLTQEDSDVEMLIALLDGVVIPGPGKEPLFVRRVQCFLADALARNL